MDPFTIIALIVGALVFMALTTAALEQIWQKVIAPFLGWVARIAVVVFLGFVAWTVLFGGPATTAAPPNGTPPEASTSLTSS